MTFNTQFKLEDFKVLTEILSRAEAVCCDLGGFGGSSWFLGRILLLCHLPFELPRFNRISLNKSKSCEDSQTDNSYIGYSLLVSRLVAVLPGTNHICVIS